MKEAIIRWKGGMAFNAHTGSGHDLVMDARVDVGGENSGPRPTELLLAALGGCTGMDVVSILRKMQVSFDRLEIAIEANEATDHPKSFTDFHLVYRVWGSDIPAEKLKRAVELSETKYCSVGGLFRKGAEVMSKLEINGTVIA